MGTLAGLIVLFFGGGYLIRSVSSARNSAWAGPRTAGMRHRAGVTRGGGASGQRPVRHEARLRRLDAELKDWLAGRDHARKNGNGTAPPSAARPPAAPGRARAAATATVKRLGQLRPAGPAGTGGAPAASRPARAPSPARPAPAAASNGSPGRTATVAAGTSTGSVEKFVEGVNQIHAEALAGGIRAKHRGVKASTEGCMRFSAMAAMLSRTMSEPGSNYGPEITEPLAKAAEHLQAAAMAFGESDTNLGTLVNMSVGELADSARQAPNHAELSENGSH
jgi:hypothetical protein